LGGVEGLAKLRGLAGAQHSALGGLQHPVADTAPRPRGGVEPGPLPL
jgi:hypothetical protein